MTAERQPAEADAVYCSRHPSVATELRCGRCERPICVRCMIHTPGGIRCPDCAQMRRPVMYELHALDYAKGTAAAVAIAAVLGVAGTILLRPGGGIPFFGLMIAIFAGAGAGSLMAAAIGRATRGKRGLALQLMAGAALVGAWGLRLAIAGALSLALVDLLGAIALAAAIAVAWQRLA